MKVRIIEIVELGQFQSLIQRENAHITELIKTDSLIEELNEQLRKQFSLEDIRGFSKWLDEEEIPYKDGSFIKYFDGKDNRVSIEWLFNKYLQSLSTKKLIIANVVGQSEQLPCPHCGQLEPCAGNSPETCYHPKVC